jgi:hypothetical protein
MTAGAEQSDTLQLAAQRRAFNAVLLGQPIAERSIGEPELEVGDGLRRREPALREVIERFRAL